MIYSRDPGEHVNHLDLVLERLKRAGLRVKTKKCTFARHELPLLGYILNNDGIRRHSDKMVTIAGMQLPQTKKSAGS